MSSPPPHCVSWFRMRARALGACGPHTWSSPSQTKTPVRVGVCVAVGCCAVYVSPLLGPGGPCPFGSPEEAVP